MAHVPTHLSFLARRIGAPMKVQQELMRHASIMTTMNVYGKAMPSIKRKANSKVVSMALGAKAEGSEEQARKRAKKRAD